MIETTNPTTGQRLATYPEHDAGEVDRRLAAAALAFERWRAVPLAERARPMRALAQSLEDEREHLARLMAEEMGKPVAGGLAEVDKCAFVCRHYAAEAERYLAPTVVATDATRSYVRYDPLGAVLAVMPWNFPFWQVFRFAAPALMAGNVALLKHASNVPGCALAIEKLFRDSGFPEGTFQTLLIDGSAVASVIADARVQAVTLTGSEAAGASVAAAAGRHLKKTVLELGGSDAFVVLTDADLERAAAVGALARTLNSGQSCIAAKRFVVEAAVAEEFTRRFCVHMKALRVGDPLDPATQVGPLARADLVSVLARQVDESVAQGAVIAVGGHPLDGPGFFYPPTVLTGVQPAHPVAAEETFGPVAAILIVGNEDEAVATANHSPYGLGASLWTKDLARAERIAERIDAGAVFVNGLVKSDPRLPFGGIKRSGYGRELGQEGIREFVNVKTVWIA